MERPAPRPQRRLGRLLPTVTRKMVVISGRSGGGNQRTRHWFPCRSSVTPGPTRGGWKPSGLVASCCGFKAVTPRR